MAFMGSLRRSPHILRRSPYATPLAMLNQARRRGAQARFGRLLGLLLLPGLGFGAFGCGPKEDEAIVKTPADANQQQIDADPIALLPSGAIGMSVIDAQKLFASDFGARIEHIARTRVPVPASAGFVPKRDLETLYIGVYSMSGVDVAGVATGKFDEAAIEAAADGITNTPLGAPLVKQEYAGRKLYVSRNIGFAVLSPKTAVFGNETGIRRILDRIEDGRVTRAIPSYMGNLLGTEGAALIAGVDLEEQAIAASFAEQFPVLKDIKSVRILGNFEPPGMHLAGTAVYSGGAEAEQGKAALLALRDFLSSMGWLTALLGVGNPIHKLEAEVEGSENKFVMALDGAAIGLGLERLSAFLGVPPQPSVIEATKSPAVKDNGL